MIVALSGIATLAVAKDPVTIVHTPTVGDSHVYKIMSVFTMGDAQAGQATASGTDTIKILKVETNGNIDVESTQGTMAISIAGQEMDQPGGPPGVSVAGPDGHLIEIRGENISPQVYRLVIMDSFIFPSKPVNIGDTWTYEYPDDPKTGIVKTMTTFKYLGDEKVDGYDCYKIASDVKEEEGANPAESKGTVWISKANGMMIKRSDVWTNVPIPTAPFPLSGTVSTELVTAPATTGTGTPAAPSTGG